MGLLSSVTKPPAKKNIFISYRVSDTAGETGRLVDSLKQHFSEDQIFIDIEKIEPGVDFTEAIAKSLGSCDVLLAIIGPNWQGFNPSTNTHRIKNADDWVRLEISTALQRNIRVVPVLVDGAELPSSEVLPDDLQPLLKRQAHEISNKRWKYDTEELIKFLVRSVGITPKYQKQEPVKREVSWWAKNNTWVIIGAVVIVALILIASLSNQNNADPASGYTPPSQTSDPLTPAVNDPVVENEEPPGVTTEKTYSVDGTWYDANGLYYFEIAQESNHLKASSYSMAGLQTGQGTGNINANEVNLNINVTNYGLFIISTTLSKDEQNLTGTLKIENNGASYSEPLRLVKHRN
jgi:hypothetical protein